MRRPRFFLNTILGVVIAAGACSRDSVNPVEPGTPSYSLQGVLSAVLLQCTPLPAASNTAVIGAEGGILTVGPHLLVVPRGALTQKVTITGQVVSGNVNSVRFSPEGLQFKTNAVLTMSYRNCSGLGMLLPKKIVYTDELLRLLDILKSIDFSGQKVVAAQLQHFSRYAIAY